MPTNTLSPADISIACKLFSGFAERTRMSILFELIKGERRVTDLVTGLGGSQGNISGHLSCLKDCGLVIDRPDGRQVFYRIAGPEVFAVLHAGEALLAVAGHTIQLCPNYEVAS